jgi:hypothetical protein
MSFTLQDFQAAAEAKYGGLVIEDAPGGPLTIRNAMAVSDPDQRTALKAAIARVNSSQVEESDAAVADAEDLDKLPELQAALTDLLAVLADRPADLHAYLDSQPLTVVVAVKDAWEASSSPKATS